jgi:orotate phosphoribosyltransferase
VTVILSQAVDLKVSDVVVLIDREQGGESRLAADNLSLHAAFPLSFILEVHVMPGDAAVDGAPSDYRQSGEEVICPCLITTLKPQRCLT